MFELIKVDIKPLSVNKVWQGRRFKTKDYANYEKALLLMLPKIKIPQAPYKVYYEFGLSNKANDWDNSIKPFQDVLQKRYGFDDKDIYEAVVKKVIVPKGQEYVKFYIESIL
jgi:Holliday junction resolvase RusA-like endonuclease